MTRQFGLRGLEGKTAIVTGAGGGIGSATVRRLLDEGCKVVAVDNQQEVLTKLTTSLPADRVLGVTADVARPEDCERFVAQAVERFGGLHLLVNNAAIIGTHYPIADMPVEEFDRVHSINVRGVFLCLRAALRHMITQGEGGAIVNLSSVGALRANRGSSPYGSAKRAVLGLSASAALENGQYGIRVNAICPGPVDTPMLRPALNDIPGDLNAVFANQAIPRAARPAEIAAFIAWLLSDESSYQTGGVYPVDGGFTI